MPLRRFWLMSGNVGRISAAKDLRRLRFQLGVGSEDGFKTYREDLLTELGNIQTIEEKLDREGLKSLAALS